MQRMTVAEAERDLSRLVDRVHSEGISIELEREDKVVACLGPAGPPSSLKVQELNAFLEKLPKLDDDAEAFSDDIRAIRRTFPAEINPWD
jgi:antitoxin (DNA-binding transcriptional repressor) of toxin-antitoxin stability system